MSRFSDFQTDYSPPKSVPHSPAVCGLAGHLGLCDRRVLVPGGPAVGSRHLLLLLLLPGEEQQGQRLRQGLLLLPGSHGRVPLCHCAVSRFCGIVFLQALPGSHSCADVASLNICTGPPFTSIGCEC